MLEPGVAAHISHGTWTITERGTWPDHTNNVHL